MEFYNKVKGAVAVLGAHLNKNHKKPLSVYFLITYRCPFSCRYCNITKNPPTKNELETDEVIDIINQMANAGTIKLHFTGGEPMTREDIGEIIKESKKRGIFTGISTSGHLIPEKIDQIRNLDMVFLALEGEKEIHEEIRGKGSFKCLEEAMIALKEAGVKFWTTTVINRKNKDSFDFILNWAKKDGFMANFAMLHSRDENYLSCFDNEEEAEEFLMTQKDYNKVIRELMGKKESDFPIGTSFSYLRHLLEWEDYKSTYKIKSPKNKCWAGKLYCFLEPDGMLYPCGTLHDKMMGRNVLETGFAKSFRELKEPFCQSCLSACQTEQNLMFSLKFEAARNWLNLI